VVKSTRPRDGRNMYAFIHAMSFISHHFHIYTSSKGAMLHPVGKYIHSSFSLFLIMFTKLNSHRGVTLFGILILGTFSSYKFVAKMKHNSSSGSLPWGSNFCKVPQLKIGKSLHFKISSNFSRALLLNLQRWTQMEQFTVSRL
jgi:hypothetical protein